VITSSDTPHPYQPEPKGIKQSRLPWLRTTQQRPATAAKRLSIRATRSRSFAAPAEGHDVTDNRPVALRASASTRRYADISSALPRWPRLERTCAEAAAVVVVPPQPTWGLAATIAYDPRMIKISVRRIFE
jgi:hypothetical protein